MSQAAEGVPSRIRMRADGGSSGSPAAGPWLIWRLAAVGVCVIAGAVLALILAVGPARLSPALVLVLVVPAGLVGADLMLTAVTLLVGKDLRLWRRGAPQLRLLLRLALVGRWFARTSRDRLFHSFIRANNRLLRAVLAPRQQSAGRPPRMLVLAPRCLQAAGCSMEIMLDPFRCERCGKCPVRDLVQLAEERGLQLHFVGGGTLARALLEQSAPEAVVAVACERELTEGILFSRKVPIIGIPNTRPKGPCKETHVEIAEVREAVDAFGV